MDEDIRHRIETAMDEMIREKGDLLGVLEPFLKKLKIKSFRKFALGYMIGAWKALGSSTITAKEVLTGRMRPISNVCKSFYNHFLDFARAHAQHKVYLTRL